MLYVLAPVLNVWVVVEELKGVKVANKDLVQAQDVHVHDPLPANNKSPIRNIILVKRLQLH